MSNGTWVCFACRSAVRRQTGGHSTSSRPWLLGSKDVGPVPCSGCGELCRFLGTKVKIPPKRNAKAWNELRESIERFRLQISDVSQQHAVRRKHDLEQRIAELKSRARGVSRERLIKKLETRLAAGL